jgi:hypothetical protein
MLLTVEHNDGGVEIHFDDEGRELLLKSISRLKPGDHDHLKTPAWAGTELTEEKQGPANALVNHLALRFWPRLGERILDCKAG